MVLAEAREANELIEDAGAREQDHEANELKPGKRFTEEDEADGPNNDRAD